MSITKKGKGIFADLNLVFLNNREMDRMKSGSNGLSMSPVACVCDCDCYNNPEGQNTVQVSVQAPDVSQW